MSDETSTTSPDRPPMTAMSPSGECARGGSQGELGEQERTTGMNAARCHVCSGTARVRVLEGYAGGRPVLHEFCLSCAAVQPRFLARQMSGKPRTGLPTLIGVVGLALGLIGALADVLIPSSNMGFGLYQQAGVALGVLLVLVGALVRVDLIVLGGAFVFVAALTADWFAGTRGQGIGWKQQSLIAASLVLLVIGVLGRYRWSLRRVWVKLSDRAALGQIKAEVDNGPGARSGKMAGEGGK